MFGMLTINNSMSKKNERLFTIGIFAMLAMLVFGFVYFVAPTAFAAEASDLISAILVIVKNIVQIVGIILAIVGIIKLVLAHVNDQGPEQKSAAIMIAAAIVLIILPSILDTIDFVSWFEQA